MNKLSVLTSLLEMIKAWYDTGKYFLNLKKNKRRRLVLVTRTFETRYTRFNEKLSVKWELFPALSLFIINQTI